MRFDKSKFLKRNADDILFFGYVSGALIAPISQEKAILSYIRFIGESEESENINSLKSKFNRMRDEFSILNNGST